MKFTFFLIAFSASINLLASEGYNNPNEAAEFLTTNAADPQCIRLTSETSLCSKKNAGIFAAVAVVRKSNDGLWRVDGNINYIQLEIKK